MKRGVRKLAGFVFIISGFVLVFNSLTTTGLAVLEGYYRQFGSITGIALIFVGIFLLMEREGKGGLLRIIRTKKFDKATKRHNMKPINDAIAKIESGDGLGRPHKLKGHNVYSMSAGKGQRILYDKNGNEITLLDYTSDHDYEEMLRGLD